MNRSLFSRILYFFVKRLVSLIYHLLFWGTYIGAKNVPKTGRVIIACNHQSHLDPPVVGAGVSRTVSFMARETLFRGFFGKYISAINAFPIDRERPIGGIKEALRRLKLDECVAVFPEGSRTFDGNLQDFLPGLVAIAQKTKSPIVPAAIEGAFDAMPRSENGKVHLFKKIAVIYSEPIPVETVTSLSTDELLVLVRQKIVENINTLRQMKSFKDKPQIAQ